MISRKIRGLIFHLNLIELLRNKIYFNNLNDEVLKSNGDTEDKSQAYNKLIKSEEILYFGKSLTTAERNTYNLLEECLDQDIAQGIILGRYVNKNSGEIIICWWKEYFYIASFILALVLCNGLMLYSIAFLLQHYDLDTNGFLVLITHFFIVQIPIFIIGYILIFPIKCFFATKKIKHFNA